ncbi:Centromere protein c, partial [Thalictrum thalictroides]
MDPLLDPSKSSLLDCAMSLLPKTFMDNKNTCEKWKQGDYPGVLKAMAVNMSKDRLDQARIVLASSSELQNSDVPQNMQNTCEDRAIPPMVKNRERRPGLGFKHARFSLRPSTSQSSLDVDMSFDIGKYPDPEEFFAAYEKHERAETELRKLRGEISTDSTQQVLTRKTRTRRPGLSERIAHYKHYNYSSDVADLNERLGSSQKTSEVVIPSSSNSIMDLEITDKHGPSQEKGVAGGGRMDSVAEPKNKVDGLLDAILINDCTNLDQDGLSNLLEEQMQIRPINMEKFDLPLLGRVRKSDANISLEQLGRSMKPSSSIHNMTKTVKDKGSTERLRLSINSTSSPAMSPLSSISLAARHFTLADRPDNTFSFSFGVDDISPVRDLTHAVGEKGAPSPHIDSGSKLDEANGSGLSFSEKFESMIKEKNLSDGNTFVDKLVTEDSAHSLDAVDYNQIEICNDTNPLLNTHDVGLEDKVEDMQAETMGTEKNPGVNDKVLDKLVTENSAFSVNLVDDNYIEHMDCSDHGLEDKIEDIGQETTASDQAEVGTMKNMQCLGNVSGPSMDKDHAPHGEASILPEPDNETHQKRPRNVLNVQSKQKAPVHNKRKVHKVENKQKAPMRTKRKREVSFRKSLAGAGTQWQDGVRRSTRKRVRPLEFWNGEQLLYGRVHDSLVTVVGCKYASPSKGKAVPTLKVESFVSGR